MFSIGAPTGTTVMPESAGPVGVLIWLARIGVYLGVFVGIGGVFFRELDRAAIRGPERDRRCLDRRSGQRCGIAGAAGARCAQSLPPGASDLRAMASRPCHQPWTVAAYSHGGDGGGAWWRKRKTPLGVARALSVLAMTGVGLSLALSGHAATAPPQWLTRPMVFLHGIGVAFWVGALAPLGGDGLAAVRRAGSGPVPVLPAGGARWSAGWC